VPGNQIEGFCLENLLPLQLFPPFQLDRLTGLAHACHLAVKNGTIIYQSVRNFNGHQTPSLLMPCTRHSTIKKPMRIQIHHCRSMRIRIRFQGFDKQKTEKNLQMEKIFSNPKLQFTFPSASI
jgi:hypothetical protein